MSLAFDHSLVSLRADGPRRTGLALLAGTLLLGGWLAWFFLARLTVYEVSRSARLEVLEAPHLIGTPVGGRIVWTGLALDREVQAGDVLLELDTSALRLELREARTRQEGLAAQLAPVREQLASQQQALAGHARIAGAKIAEARARLDESQTTAGLSSREAGQARLLESRGVLSRMEAAREGTQARVQHSMATAALRALERTEAEQRSDESLLRAGVAQLSREVAQLEGQRAAGLVAIEVLTQHIEARTIRAPIAGRLGDVQPLRPGTVVGEGATLCTLIPRGKLKVVAEFSPGDTLGRVRPGQPARVQLEGFPWPRYGSLEATVSGVASEVHEGRLRVELRLQPVTRSSIPLEHGLPGRVEVALEHASPAVLVLRAAGRRLEGSSGGAG